MRDAAVVVRGTDRPDLFREVVRVDDEQEDERVLHDLMLGDLPDGAPGSLRDVIAGSGIVYTATTRAAQQTADWLRASGIPAERYHGRLKKRTAQPFRLRSWMARCA